MKSIYLTAAATLIAISAPRTAYAGMDLTISPRSNDTGSDPREPSKLQFQPSTGFDLFRYNIRQRSVSLGLIPGVGWGVKFYRGADLSKDPFWSIDLFVNAGIIVDGDAGEQSFVVGMNPTFSMADWFSIGVGVDLSLPLGGEGVIASPVLSIGIKPATQKSIIRQKNSD